MRTLSLILGITMLLLVFTIAGVFSFTPFMADEMQGNKRTSFIVLLWLYGIYRSYRLYVLLKNMKKNAA